MLEKNLKKWRLKYIRCPICAPVCPCFRVPCRRGLLRGVWSLVQTCSAFREQWVQERLLVLEEQEMFEADLEEIADLDEFLEYQDELEEMEAAQASLHFDDVNDDVSEDDLSLFNINQIRDLKLKPKQQAPWCKPAKNLDKIPCKVPTSRKKGTAYRIQQPRAVM